MQLPRYNHLSPDACQLEQHRIDIWQYPLEPLHPSAYHILSADERQRAHQFHFERHQRRFTMARACMRLILARYLSIPPTAILFNYTAHGKPEINNDSAIQFNLSHSSELALLAIGQTYPLGVDLEFFAARPYFGIGQHAFSASENTALQNVRASMRPLSFFHIWSQKEAFIKTSGLGLSYQTQTFTVSHVSPSNETLFDSKHNKLLKMQSFMPKIGCCAALCYDPIIDNIRYITLDEVCRNELF